MKILTIAVFIAALLTGTAQTRAMMNPDGSMMQLDLYDQAETLVKDKSFDKAIALLRDILREYPAHANAWNLLGFSSRMLGKFDEAETYYDNALTITPTHVGALNYKGQMYVQTGRLDEARAMLAKLESACGDGCEAYTQLEIAIRDGKAGNY